MKILLLALMLMMIFNTHLYANEYLCEQGNRNIVFKLNSGSLNEITELITTPNSMTVLEGGQVLQKYVNFAPVRISFEYVSEDKSVVRVESVDNSEVQNQNGELLLFNARVIIGKLSSLANCKKR